MDDPVNEIGAAIARLCASEYDVQQRTSDEFFVPEAEFVHPFCKVP
jgi:hypothetical protein